MWGPLPGVATLTWHGTALVCTQVGKGRGGGGPEQSAGWRTMPSRLADRAERTLTAAPPS